MNYLEQELYSLIQKDHEIFNFIQDSALDGMWYWDLEKPEEEWMNKRFWATLGYNPNQMPHKSSAWQDIIHPEDLKLAIGNFQKHCADPNHPYDQVVRYTHKKGHQVWIRCRGMAVRDAEGKPIRMLGAHTDVSAEKENSLELQKRIARYDHIISGTNLGTWEFNQTTDEYIVSTRWASIIGLNHSELELDKINPLTLNVHPEDIRKSNLQLENHYLGKENFYECELRVKHKNGSWIWVHDKGKVFDWSEEGKPLWIIGSRLDISQRKQLEEREKEIHAQNTLFIDQAPSAIAMFDTDMRYLAASKKWYKDYNLGPESVIGKSHYDIFPEIGEEWKVHHRACLKGRIERADEDKFVREDGSIQWITYEVRPWYTQQNTVGGLLMYTADITKIKEAEKQVRSLLDVATSQNKRLLNFAHIVSHNLRSHTGNLTMLSEIMESEEGFSTENEVFNLLSNAIQNLSETVMNLHEVAVMNSSTAENLVNVNVLAHVNGAIKAVQGIIIESKAKIEIEIDPELEVSALPAYMESIFLNLLTNAIKYAASNRHPVVKLQAKPNGTMVELSVSDNGRGIDLNLHGDKIFGMYKTFHNHKDSRGLGLFMIKNQVESMGGDIEVHSIVDEGTTFKIVLNDKKY